MCILNPWYAGMVCTRIPRSMISKKGRELGSVAANHSFKGSLRTETVLVKVIMLSAVEWLLTETSKAPDDCNRRKDVSLVNISSAQRHAMRNCRIRRASIISLQRKRKAKCWKQVTFHTNKLRQIERNLKNIKLRLLFFKNTERYDKNLTSNTVANEQYSLEQKPALWLKIRILIPLCHNYHTSVHIRMDLENSAHQEIRRASVYDTTSSRSLWLHHQHYQKNHRDESFPSL